MAKITGNPRVKGARGKFGDEFVYKQRGGVTFISRIPQWDKDRPATPGQAEMRDRFSLAAAYASWAMNYPDLKREYAKVAPTGKTANNMAFRDFMQAPEVSRINAADYTGQPGSSIVVTADDDFRVAEVLVQLFAADGSLLEEGAAQLQVINRSSWTYTASKAVAPLSGCRIRATARDIPGNEASLEIIL